jgi:hypothetical protein
MKLKANVITKGKYYRAGEDIPDDLLSDALRKYALSPDEERSVIEQQRSDADGVEWKPSQVKLSSKRYVKRGDGFKRVDSVETTVGELLYKRDLNSPTPRFVRYGKVQA